MSINYFWNILGWIQLKQKYDPSLFEVPLSNVPFCEVKYFILQKFFQYLILFENSRIPTLMCINLDNGCSVVYTRYENTRCYSLQNHNLPLFTLLEHSMSWFMHQIEKKKGNWTLLGATISLWTFPPSPIVTSSILATRIWIYANTRGTRSIVKSSFFFLFERLFVWFKYWIRVTFVATSLWIHDDVDNT